MKKYILIVLFVVLGAGSSVAQDWETDFTSAKAVANKKDMPIILVFQGSDWCTPCIKLDREVWNTNDFKVYAKEHYVMLQADFPRRKRNALSLEQTNRNKVLAEKYNRNGIFPFVVIMDDTGKVLGETSYKRLPVMAYIEELNTFIK
ncbi:thioredoxin family protein [Maribacter sp. ACAM166]|uniref:thioredoxin family protein n=1 Tax=Maribacter sp. ACAM166 TaxID=2508996 RepID=UPI0010FCDCC9|nr:thioredoxin family protein [Maribacter sp. ACAM166]TLP77256.1 thioredoxin family protein [Maribacter sp. ACAM166]